MVSTERVILPGTNADTLNSIKEFPIQDAIWEPEKTSKFMSTGHYVH